MAGTLEGTIKIPVVGTVKKKYAIAGVAITLALIGITLYRRKKASETGASVTDPAGNVCAAVNPQTGYCPGTPEDTAYLAQNTNLGGGPGGGGDGGNGGHHGPPFANNEDWAAYARQYLVDKVGLNSSHVSQALGDYLQGKPVDTPEETIINEAISFAGPVPVPATDGFPPSIHHKGTKHGGKEHADNPVNGLHATRVEKTVADIDWKPAAHAGSYQVTLMRHTGTDGSQHPGSQRVKRFDVTESKARLSGLKAGTTYTVHVLARPPKPSAHDAQTTFTTKRAMHGSPSHPPTPTNK